MKTLGKLKTFWTYSILHIRKIKQYWEVIS